MSRRDMAVVILDEMKMFDQQITPAGSVRKQRANLFKRLRIDLAALGRTRRTAAALTIGLGFRRILHIHFVTSSTI
jgi:hypothetical protein